MVTPIHEFIPTLVIGRRRYTHYPIRPMSRQEAEEILRQPWMRHMMLVRTSERAQEEHPDLYYVLSYRHEVTGVLLHVIITRRFHNEYDGVLPFLLSHSSYYLPLLPDHPAFQDTRQQEEEPPHPMEEEPNPVEENEQPSSSSE
jgi:hypothetical protein